MLALLFGYPAENVSSYSRRWFPQTEWLGAVMSSVKSGFTCPRHDRGGRALIRAGANAAWSEPSGATSKKKRP